MKKILHLQTELNIACGVSKTIYLIIKHSDKSSKHYIAVLGGDGFERFLSINITPQPIKTVKLFKYINLILFIIKFCKQNRIDIIHSHHRLFDSIAWVVQKFLNVKTIMSVQSKVNGKRIFSYKSDILIACSETIEKHLIAYFKINHDRIQIINNCFEVSDPTLKHASFVTREKLSIPSSAIVLGFFGRFSFKEKGLDLLLKVFEELVTNNEQLFLLLVGSGPDKKNIIEFVQKHPSKVLVIESQTDLSEYFSLIDSFILPSRVDPFPLAMLEAGYFSKPFIGANVDGIAELIRNGENGLLFEKGDSEGLKSSILTLLKNRDYSEKLANALHEEVTEKYSVETIIPKYYSLYESISKN